MTRAVFDANVVVSALIRPEGTCGRILGHVLRRDAGVRAIVSPAILDEYHAALGYPKVLRMLRLPEDEVAALVDAFALLSDVVSDERTVQVVADDADDDKYIAAAIEGRASHVVSGDRHLLGVGSFEGVRMITPREFLDLLDDEPEQP